MDDLVKYFEKMSSDLKSLGSDIQKIVQNKKENKDFKDVNLKSMQKITTLYKNKAEIDQAKESPEVDFITKKIEDIFSR